MKPLCHFRMEEDNNIDQISKLMDCGCERLYYVHRLLWIEI